MNFITSTVVVLLVTSYCLVESLPQYPQGQVTTFRGVVQGISGLLRVVQVYIELSESYLFYIGKKKDKLLSWLFMKSSTDLHLNKNTEVGREMVRAGGKWEKSSKNNSRDPDH
jgi:hypothetical protein